MAKQSQALSSRLWGKFFARKDDECWFWLGAKNNMGYGKIGIGGKHGGWALAHRAVFEIVNGPIRGVLSHSCDNPACVNPSHLIDTTMSANSKDMAIKGHCNLGWGEMSVRHG